MWRHYKGGIYQVVGYGHDANYEDRTVVVYLSFDLTQDGPRFAVRTVEDFLAVVHPADGSTCPAAETCTAPADAHRPRFTFERPA